MIEDACADANAQVHEVLMDKVFSRQAFVVKAKAFLEQHFDTH